MNYQKIKGELRRVTARELRRIKTRPFYALAPVLAMAFCCVFFLTFMKEGLPNRLPIAVVDLDQSALSRTYISNLGVTNQSAIVAKSASYGEALDLMQRGKIYAFVVIPRDLEREVTTGRAPEITYYINGSYLIAGSLLLKDITLMNALTSAAAQQKILIARGFTEHQTMAVIQPIVIDNHMIANPRANYGVYLINVLLPGVLQLFVLMLTLLAIGLELKERTARAWVRVGGGSLFVSVLGKLLPYTVLLSTLGVITNIVLYKYMHFPMNGSFAMMCLATVLYVIATQCVAVFMIGLFPSIRHGISLGAFFGLLGFTYAGFTFPIEAMPVGTQIFSSLFPIRHYYRIYVAEALNGVGGQYTMLYFAALVAFILLPLIIWKRLRNAIELN